MSERPITCTHRWSPWNEMTRDRTCGWCGLYQTEAAAALVPGASRVGDSFTVKLLSFGSDGTAHGELISAVTFKDGQPVVRSIGQGTPTPRHECDEMREHGTLESARKYGL